MHVTLVPTTPLDRVALDNLWQLYVYDFSEQMDLPLGDDGRFEGRAFDAWWVDPWPHAFLVRVDGAPPALRPDPVLRHARRPRRATACAPAALRARVSGAGCRNLTCRRSMLIEARRSAIRAP